MASVPCHRSRHVEFLQECSCCLNKWDVAITSTIYASVASLKVTKACFVHSWGCLSGNSSTNIPVLTKSWCSILQTEWTNTSVDDGGFLLQAVINWSRSSRAYISSTLCRKLMAVYQDMDILTSNCMLLVICATCSVTDDLSMCILGHIFGSCIGSIAVE